MNYKHIGQKSDQISKTDSNDNSLSRRNFLRNSSTASVGAGLVVTSKTALGQEGADKGKKSGVVLLGMETKEKLLENQACFSKIWFAFQQFQTSGPET